MEKEQLLVKRIQKNRDIRAANELISFYYPQIYAFAYRQVGNVDKAMDLTQDIFEAVLRSMSSYDPRKASFRTWLYRIASNKIVDHFRSARLPIADFVDMDNCPDIMDSSMEQRAENKQLMQQVYAEIQALPFDIQQILRLKLFSECKFTEIATVMSLPESTVKTKYYTALKTIRRKVFDYED